MNRNPSAVFGLLGRTLGHSYSPAIHARLGSYAYHLFERNPEDVEPFVKCGEWQGLNVTIPYKETVMAFCDSLSDAAQAIGSVNTLIRRPDGTIFGDNTDYFGFEYLLDSNGFDVQGEKVLVLGDGGAAKTIRAVLADRQAASVVTVSRKGPVTYRDISRHADAGFIVNTTPVGMYPNCPDAPVDLEAEFTQNGTRLKGVADIVYNPLRTGLILQAEKLGIPCANGLSMLVAQAKRASELFQGCAIEDSRLESILRDVSSQMRSIVLIGMPGSGKSTIGSLVAERLGRPFVDADAEIERRTNKTIPQIFEEDGEAGFRDLETAVLADICKTSGAVISCGGGAVCRPVNRDLIRQNALVVLVTRPLDRLACEGRPMTGLHGIEALYAARKDLYEQCCDAKVDNSGTVESAVEAVIRACQSNGQQTR